MDFSGKKIGIWGFGVVGKSLVNYFIKKDKASLSVIEKREFSSQEIEFFNLNNISYYQQDIVLESFFEFNDYILISPGINSSNYTHYKFKFLNELDIFFSEFKKTIIAITGTVGKTTTTKFLEQLFKQNGKNIIAAGNVGLGMCDLIEIQDNIDGVILELSSFQLEYCKDFAPEFAIWTNFYPNHLDRHLSMQNYFECKEKMIINQNHSQISLLPLEISNMISKKIKSQINYFSLKKPTQEQLENISFNNIFYFENFYLYKINKNFEEEIILHIDTFPDLTYLENWLIISACLYLQKLKLNFKDFKFDFIEHRFEKFTSINDVDFYNDSKSTIPNSTLAAVSKLEGKPIILFLGGISKGVDRSKMVEQLKNKVKKIICFGKEAKDLKKYCDVNGIESYEFSNLENAISNCFDIMKPKDQVLFSPSGTSFDLYSNYIERGDVFKKIVNNFKK